MVRCTAAAAALSKGSASHRVSRTSPGWAMLLGSLCVCEKNIECVCIFMKCESTCACVRLRVVCAQV